MRDGRCVCSVSSTLPEVAQPVEKLAIIEL